MGTTKEKRGAFQEKAPVNKQHRFIAHLWENFARHEQEVTTFQATRFRPERIHPPPQDAVCDPSFLPRYFSPSASSSLRYFAMRSML